MKLKSITALGLLFLTAAILLILSATGILSPETARILVSWQALIVVAGIYTLPTGHYGSGAAITLTGAYFMIPFVYKTLGIPAPFEKGTLTTLFIASLLIVAAIAVLTSGRRIIHSSKSFFEIKPDKQGIPQITCAFGETKHTVIEQPFRGAEVSTAFGAMTLDLSKTILPEGDTYVVVENAFGSTDIIVPEWWAVKFISQNFFGQARDTRSVPPAEGDRRLIVRGAVAFGSVEIQGASEEETEPGTGEETIETISVKRNNRVHIIPLDELHSIQAEGDYVTLCTVQGNFLKEQTMKYFQNALPADRFVRIHRSCIVSLAEVASVDCRGKEVYYVVLKDGTALRASASGYQELKQRLEI